MKNTNIRILFVVVCTIFEINLGFSQNVNDSTASKPVNAEVNYKWTELVLQSVNLDSIKQLKDGHTEYLKNIEMLEERLDRNRKELKILTSQANDEAKVISNERQHLADKKRFAKEGEKLLKSEKSLRDKELKLLNSDRKELKRSSKDIDKEELKERVAILDEKDNKIKDLESKWNSKRSELKNDLNNIAESESSLDRREVEVKNRLRELDRQKEALDLKARQLNLEKKQVKQQLKKLNAL
jgi:chromosome segregation ATPase